MYKVVLFSIAICIGLVAIPSLVFDFGDWTELILRSSVGFFFGLLIAPEIDRKIFRSPAVFQSISGFCCGFTLAYLLNASSEWVLLSALIGFFMGFTARWWVKHIPLP
ncbi:hypothetical protein L4C38_20190 [Vibrio kasasachensis]|uniref:hypothetical protein n=1 Tax=Vibrio kasasachensis TaxID=2910248 RepID=UPI003D0AB07B